MNIQTPTHLNQISDNTSINVSNYQSFIMAGYNSNLNTKNNLKNLNHMNNKVNYLNPVNIDNINNMIGK
jgi:hypothetical protein